MRLQGVQESVNASYYDSATVAEVVKAGGRVTLFGNANVGQREKANILGSGILGNHSGHMLIFNWYVRTDIDTTTDAWKRFSNRANVDILINDKFMWQRSIADLHARGPWIPLSRRENLLTQEEMDAIERDSKEGHLPIMLAVKRHFAAILHVPTDWELTDRINGTLWVEVEGVSTRDVY